MGALDDLRVLDAPVDNPVATAAFIAKLNLGPALAARLLRSYLKEAGYRLTAEILVAARDYSVFL